MSRGRPTQLRRGVAAGRRQGAGFTLWELLIVLAIIALVSSLSLPALKGLQRGNAMTDAQRQLLDDLAYARQRALKDRATVHVLFVPPTVTDMGLPPDHKLRRAAYTTYAIFTERQAGDQPGRPQFRYLTDWKRLPEGVFIATNQFEELAPAELWNPARNREQRPFEYWDFPFPTSVAPTNRLPHLAFNFQGRLVYKTTNLIADAFIWLTRGSIMELLDSSGQPYLDVREQPRGNWLANTNRIRLDGFTGRARYERREIQ